MAYYLNCKKVLSLYESETRSQYFVDKTLFLEEMFKLVNEGNRHICITRPRRFGKSVMATMVGSFFSKGLDSGALFDGLKISQSEEYRKHLNAYDVIYIDFSEAANDSKSYDEFIAEVKETLQEDIRGAFSDVNFRSNGSVLKDLRALNEQTGVKFIFVFDEWDCIFHKTYTTDENRRSFIEFLAALTKGTGYVALTYMTGILSIAKYSSGSTINHFDEYSMVTDDKYSRYFGFTDADVDELYARYECRIAEEERMVTREGLREWYDGYRTPSTARMYNPRSVVFALERNQIRSYWTSTGPYSEISTYIVNDIDDIKKDIALMLTGASVETDALEFAAAAMNLSTREEILSAMVVYGFLNYEGGAVRIPNRELMDEFGMTIRREPSLGYIYSLAKESRRMLQATLEGDTEVMEEILAFAHNTEVPLLSYNHETELTAIVNLVYLAARDKYIVEREEKAGKGYVDFIFYPDRTGDAGIILELKVDDTPENAIQQIKDKGYHTKFLGKMAQRKRQAGRLLAVGISYDKDQKDHHCKVEVIDL